MANTFKWSIEKLRVTPQDGDKTNIVVQADWLCVAVNEEDAVQAAASGIRNFTLGDSFTPFDQLTEEQVLEWCFAPEVITWTDKDNVEQSITEHFKADGEAQVSGQIARQLAQKASEPKLPWVADPVIN
jgi:hypothetical protein